MEQQRRVLCNFENMESLKLAAIILDDEPLARKVIEEYLAEIDNVELIASCSKAVDAIQILKERKVDMVFLDIEMPKINGLEFLEISQPKAQVIITTAYKEYAVDSYNFTVCDYLVKPFRFDRFYKAIEKARLNISSKLSPQNDHVNLVVKSEKKLIPISSDEIQYLESYGNYVKIWTDDKYILTLATLANMLEQVPESTFNKIHKSYVINRNKIDYIEGNQVIMKNTKSLPISKNYKQEFIQSVKK